MKAIKNKVSAQNTKKNFVMFNNTFFTKRNKTCKIGKNKVRYAAVCNAVEFGKYVKTKYVKTKKAKRVKK